ncbi:SLC13 family permease [Miniphocaeibacter massiliensis]|uniref:SLC13 family permease n=1 Tax=Miniphocaeibacter massiliensis TaxID=2041841 RepID=UPI000C1C6BD1|nr:SLC13 family permease [Miniphocaeibacter massiliensis]
MERKLNLRILKYFGFLMFVLAGGVIGIGQVFDSKLDKTGHLTVMLLLITIGLWIFKPFNLPFSVSGCFFMAGLLAIGVPSNIVFSGFSGTALWSLIPALFFGVALAKTGLGRRIAYFGMKSIKVTYPNILLMWMIIGIILSLLTPSITVRVVIVMPIALQCVEICKLKYNSKGRSLILITAWIMAIIPGLGWQTGSLAGPMLSGFYEAVPKLRGLVTFNSWAKVLLLPIVIISALTVIASYFVLKPSEKLNIGKNVFLNEYKKLGTITREEIITAIILVASFLFFVTNSIHKIPDASVCLMALFLLTATKIIEVKDISTGISWDLVIFIGTAMSFGSVFAETGVSKWMSDILVELLYPISSSPWIFMPIVLVIMFLWRFVDIAGFAPTVAIIIAISPEVFSRYKINPLIWLPLLCIAMNSFFLSYTNMFALVAQSNMKEKGWSQKHLTKYGIVYFVVSLITVIAVIPYWKNMGLFG